MKLPFETARAATGARVINPDRAPAFLRVTTDTRALQPGDTFLALRGERFDGHAFVAEAAAKGAAAFVVEDASVVPPGVAAFVAGDTLKAYMALAELARAQFAGRVVAITGSAGKTTTKFFTAQLLATRYGDRVLASPANENNEIGVSKLLLNATNEEHDVLVVEMGARHYGDIAVLTKIAQPHVAVLTNVGDAHLEIMGSRERLEETKWSIFEKGARAIVNECDRASRIRAASLPEPAHWFLAGAPGATLPSRARITALLGRDWFVHRFDGVVHECAVAVAVPGDHNRSNLAAAAAAALELGADFGAVARAMETIELPKGRYEAHRRRRHSPDLRCVQRQRERNDRSARRFCGRAGDAADCSALQYGRAGRRSRATAPARRRACGGNARRRRCSSAAISRTSLRSVRCDAGFPRSASFRFASNSEAAQWLRATRVSRRCGFAQGLAQIQVRGNR